MDDTDLKMYKAFRTLVHKGSYDLQGEAVVTAASLFQWFNGLEKKIQVQINLNSDPAIKIQNIKPIEGEKDASK